MRLFRLRAILFGLALFLHTLVTTAGHAANQDRHVIVVSIDGLAAYLLDDPKAPLPTIRRLAREGTVAANGMKVSNPSVTWPNHTSLVTGTRPEKHGVLANGMFIRGAIDVPVFLDGRRDQSELVRVPTIFDAAHAAGLTTAEINWPCTRGSKTLHDSFPDVPDAVVHCTPRLRADLVKMGLLADETQASFVANSGPSRDLIWTEAACHVIRDRKPNLFLVHLLNVDSTHHTLGPQTAAGYTANALADLCLSRIVAAIHDCGIHEQTTLIVLADHGFTMTPKAICPHVLLREKGLLHVSAGKIQEARVHVISEGGTGLVYCTHPGEAAADAEKVRAMFQGLEGVAEVLLPEQYAKYGMPHPREYSQSPDAILVAEDGYGVSTSVDGNQWVTTNTDGKTALGSHGFISTNQKMNAICVFAGRDIRPEGKIADVENIDIAPTIAKLLGLEFAADGKVLTQAIQSQ